MDVSIVVPVYNEEESVEPLYNALTKAMSTLPYTYEIVLVDDGSKDDTFFNAKQMAVSDPRLKVVKLKSNYGQTTALHAGFKNATGRIIITMDGDLQNDPDDIKVLIEKLYEGNDIVLGWRSERKDFLISRKIPSRIANWLIRKVTGVPVKDNGCAIRAYRSEVVRDFPMYSEMHRLMPVITALAGAKFTQIKVKHHERKYGQSKYGLSRIYKVLLDLVALKTVFAFFNLPLYGFGIFAGFSAILSLFTFLGSIYIMLTQPGKPLVVLMGASILFASLSAFLFFLGFISQLIYSTGNVKIEKLLKSRKLNKNFIFN